MLLFCKVLNEVEERTFDLKIWSFRWQVRYIDFYEKTIFTDRKTVAKVQMLFHISCFVTR